MVLVQRLARGVGTLIGLGQEAHAHRMEKKQTEKKAASEEKLATSNIVEDDETPISATKTRSKSQQDSSSTKEGSLTSYDWFTHRHPHLPQSSAQQEAPQGRLPAPVLIPQKRPNNKARGFVAAYAPDLEARGVDQAAFLDFIHGFVREPSDSRKAFNVLNVSVALSMLSYTAAFGVSPTLHFAATAVHLTIETGKRLYVNQKTSGYLERVNKTYFQPRGLFALIMTYDPDSADVGQVLDFDTQTAVAVDDAESPSWTQRFKSSSTETLQSHLPKVCPLVYPQDPYPNGQNSPGRLKRTVEFTQDYFDRRARATFGAHNADSQLNMQEQEFAGRYADPTMFEHSGLIGVATGGMVDPCRQRFDQRQKADMESSDSRQRGGVLCKIKQGLREKVLYLMVVNMPSESELEQARELVERMEAQK